MESHLGNRVTQKSERIDQLFKSIGLSNFCKDSQGLLGRKNLVRRVEILVQRRHSIAHAADLNSHGKPRVINSQRVRKQIEDLELFVMGVDEPTVGCAVQSCRGVDPGDPQPAHVAFAQLASDVGVRPRLVQNSSSLGRASRSPN